MFLTAVMMLASASATPATASTTESVEITAVSTNVVASEPVVTQKPKPRVKRICRVDDSVSSVSRIPKRICVTVSE